MRKLGTMGSGCAPRAGCHLRTLLAKMLGPLIGWFESTYVTVKANYHYLPLILNSCCMSLRAMPSLMRMVYLGMCFAAARKRLLRVQSLTRSATHLRCWPMRVPQKKVLSVRRFPVHSSGRRSATPGSWIA